MEYTIYILLSEDRRIIGCTYREFYLSENDMIEFMERGAYSLIRVSGLGVHTSEIHGTPNVHGLYEDVRVDWNKRYLGYLMRQLQSNGEL